MILTVTKYRQIKKLFEQQEDTRALIEDLKSEKYKICLCPKSFGETSYKVVIANQYQDEMQKAMIHRLREKIESLNGELKNLGVVLDG